MLVKHAGPRPAANIVNGLLAAGRKDNTGKPVVLLGGGATCGNAVGREIERTTSELWREGVPLIGAEKTHRRGEIHVDVWHLKGGGWIIVGVALPVERPRERVRLDLAAGAGRRQAPGDEVGEKRRDADEAPAALEIHGGRFAELQQFVEVRRVGQQPRRNNDVRLEERLRWWPLDEIVDEIL